MVNIWGIEWRWNFNFSSRGDFKIDAKLWKWPINWTRPITGPQTVLTSTKCMQIIVIHCFKCLWIMYAIALAKCRCTTQSYSGVGPWGARQLALEMGRPQDSSPLKNEGELSQVRGRVVLFKWRENIPRMFYLISDKNDIYAAYHWIKSHQM